MGEADWQALRHFRREEFGPHADQMEPELLLMLDEARELAGIPFSLSSTFRRNDNKSHGLGRAVDIRCHMSGPRFAIVRALLQVGFHRIGVYDRHIHADIGEAPGFPAHVMWVGTSE